MTALWGVYDNVTQAQEIVQKLRDAGVPRDAITVITVTTSSRKPGTEEPGTAAAPASAAPTSEATAEAAAEEVAPAPPPVVQSSGPFADLNTQSSYSIELLRTLPGLGVSRRDAATAVRRAHDGSVVLVVDYKGSDIRPIIEILQSAGRNRSERIENDLLDLLTTEQQAMSMVGRQLRNKNVQMYGEVTALINRVDFVLKDHIAGLRRHLGVTETPSATFFQQATEVVMNLVANATDRLRGDSVALTLCEDYRVLSLAAMKYTKLHTTALAKYDYAIAELALRHLQDLTQVLIDISKAIPGSTEQELRESGEIVDGAAVSSRALENTQQAWTVR